MPDTLTSFFGFTKPALHSTGWGPKANSDFDQWDSVLGIPRAAFVAPAIGATTNLDLSLGSAFRLSLTQATTFAILNPSANPAGVSTQVWQEFRLLLVGDGTRRVVTWPGSVSWLSGQVPVLTPSGTDAFVFFTKDNGATWLGIHQTVVDLPPFTATTYNAAGTTNIDLATGRNFKFTVAGGISTIAFINFTQNTPIFRILITNGGSQVLTWPGSVVWLSGAPPTLQAAGVDELEFTTPDGGVTWYGARLDPSVTTEHAKVAMNANQAVVSGTDVVIVWDGAEFYDVGGLHDPASNPSRLIVPAAWTGTEAEIVAQIAWQAMGGNASSDAWIRKNGSIELSRVHVDTGPGGGSPIQQVVAHDNSPAANDYYEIIARQASGVSENVLASKSWARLARKR